MSYYDEDEDDYGYHDGYREGYRQGLRIGEGTRTHLQAILSALSEATGAQIQAIALAVEEIVVPEELERPTSTRHTLFVRQIADENGCYRYSVTHNLGSEDISVEVLDYSDAVLVVSRGKDSITIVSTDDLFGKEVVIAIDGEEEDQ